MAQTVWITGLSGAGKTTVGKVLYARQKKERSNIVFLDGDHFREIMGDGLGHDHNDRLKNAYRLARMCAFLNSENIEVICATMSLYPEVWAWCRTHIPGYVQVYIQVPKEVLIRRDPKGMYQEFLNGTRTNIIGFDLEFNEPMGADLVIANHADDHGFAEQAADQIEGFLKQKGRL